MRECVRVYAYLPWCVCVRMRMCVCVPTMSAVAAHLQKMLLMRARCGGGSRLGGVVPCSLLACEGWEACTAMLMLLLLLLMETGESSGKVGEGLAMGACCRARLPNKERDSPRSNMLN